MKQGDCQRKTVAISILALAAIFFSVATSNSQPTNLTNTIHLLSVQNTAVAVTPTNQLATTSNIGHHINFNATIIVLFIWAVVMWGHGGLKPHLPASYRLQNICLSLLLVLGASSGLDLIFWSVLHPSLILKYFYVQSGIFPPAASLLITSLSIFSSCLQMNIGFGMAQQRRKARILAVRFIPYFAIVDVVEAVRTISFHANSKNLIFTGSILIMAIVGFYFWLYRFCKSKQTEALMTNLTLSPTLARKEL